MDQGFEIRPLESGDFEEFLEIQKLALLSAPDVFGSDYSRFDSLSILNKEQRFVKYLLFPYQYILGAVTPRGTVVGMVGFSCDNSSSKIKHKAKIWGLYVVPEHRGKGVASLLVNTVLNEAIDIGVELVQLSVSTQNRASYSLYLRLGFTVYGTEPRSMKVDNQYIDEYLMVKIL